MANTIDWGKATQNNTNGFGKYQNTINAGDIYEDSWAGETALIGTSAAFSYSKSSYHQDEADPTPTITGTTGGTFSATPSGLSINTSTGTIDLSASTIQPYTITYTVSGVSANFSLSVTASPFLANTYSMEFDGASSQYIDAGQDTSLDTGDLSASIWINKDSAGSGTQYVFNNNNGSTKAGFIFAIKNSNEVFVGRRTRTKKAETGWINVGFTEDVWNNLAFSYNDTSGDFEVWFNGNSIYTSTASSSTNAVSQNITIGTNSGLTGLDFDGKLDEAAIWNTALSSDAVQEIYNATANNTGKALDLSTDYNNYTSSSNLQYWNRLGD